MVVTIPRTGQGAQFAAPTAKEIYQGIYGVGRPAALPGGKLPTALPRVNKDGTISPPGSPLARTTSADTSTGTSSTGVLPAGLAFARSLGRAGVPVYGAAFRPNEFGLRSRYLRGRCLATDGPEETRDGRVLAYLRVLASAGRPILVPERDEHVDRQKQSDLLKGYNKTGAEAVDAVQAAARA